MLRVGLLGEQVVGDDNGRVRLRSSRSIALIAFLAMRAGVTQTRQRIAGLFWPDSTDEQALTNLRRELHHLRAVLEGSAALVVTSRDLCWQDHPTVVVDVLRFRREHTAALTAARAGDPVEVLAHAATAVGLYRGEFLPGNDEDWVRDVRVELERQCVDLLDLLRDRRAATGDLIGAVDAARHRIRLRQLEEIGYRTLMELQGDLGDRAGAVSTYHHCASVLERELGVDPDPATRASLDRLLTRTDAVVAPGPGAGARSGPAAVPLVGRAGECHALLDLWRTAAGGRPTLAVVSGDAGVGKTRLVVEVADTVRRLAVVATARCFGTPGRLALSPVAEWLRIPAVRATLPGLDAVWRAEVERLVPSGEPRQPVANPGSMVDAWQRHRFFEGLARALIAVDRPLLLVLDNLHWCDQETLAFLTFCLGLTTDAPIMVVATARRGDADAAPGLEEWLRGMRATGLLIELALGPLEAVDTAALAAAITGRAVPAPDAELLQATTGGYPLSVIEAARTVDDDPGDAFPVGDLAAVLEHRYEQITAAAGDLLGLAAAVGRTFTLDLLTEASDLPADEVVRAVDELWRRRILREVGDGYDFSHDLLRDAAYRRVGRPQRWLLHRRIAQGLELLHADDPNAVSAQLAEQYAQGGRPERAVEFYLRAARVASGIFAHAEAVRLHDAALAVIRGLPPGRDRDTRELLVLEATAAPLNARSGYSAPRLREVLDRTIALAEELGHRDALVNGLVSLWSAQFVHGETAAAHRTAARALDVVASGSELEGAAHFAFGGATLSLGRPEEALRHFAIAANLGRNPSLSVGSHPDVHGMAFAAHAHWLCGHDDDTLASCNGAIALSRISGSPYNVAVALAYAAVTHQLRGDRSALVGVVDELRELCTRYDFAYYREWGTVLDGWVCGGTAGLELAQRGIDTLVAADSFARMPYWLSLLADLADRAGRVAEASATLDAAMAGGQARDDLWWLPEVLRMRARYDDRDRAVARLRSAAQLAAQHGSVALVRRCARDLAAFGVRPPTSDGAPTT